jgi:drug/metabolite transporter (DMT)-like permease
LKKSVSCILASLLIGGTWYLNRGRPPWEEAIRTAVVLRLLLILLKFGLKRISLNLRIVPILVATTILIVIAAFTEAALINSHSVQEPTVVVSIGLVLAVAATVLLGGGHFLPQRVLPSSEREQGGPIAR